MKLQASFFSFPFPEERITNAVNKAPMENSYEHRQVNGFSMWTALVSSFFATERGEQWLSRMRQINTTERNPKVKQKSHFSGFLLIRPQHGNRDRTWSEWKCNFSSFSGIEIFNFSSIHPHVWMFTSVRFPWERQQLVTVPSSNFHVRDVAAVHLRTAKSVRKPWATRKLFIYSKHVVRRCSTLKLHFCLRSFEHSQDGKVVGETDPSGNHF